MNKITKLNKFNLKEKLLKEDIIKMLNILDFPMDEYYVLSTGSMVIRGIKMVANDLDLCISPKVFEIIKEEFNIGDNDFNESGFYKITDKIEVVIGNKENFKSEFSDGYFLEDLNYLLSFKKKRNKEKDIVDIKLIENYLKNK